MKKLSLILVFISMFFSVVAQNSNSKSEKKEARRQKINEMIRQSEEGILIYHKQSIFGLQARSNGYGIFYELGKMKSFKKTTTYRIDITEIKNQKEDKVQNAANGFIIFGNPYIYGKVNNFYQATLGFGKQQMLGQKGNKNGVAVSAIYNGGLALGLLRPYYLEVQDPSTNETRLIKYSSADSALFLGPTILGGGGLGKGWSEMKMKPGVFAKAALRFDYGRFNEMVSGLEVGLSGEFYTEKIPIMAGQDDRQFFFQAYISLLFGRRK